MHALEEPLLKCICSCSLAERMRLLFRVVFRQFAQGIIGCADQLCFGYQKLLVKNIVWLQHCTSRWNSDLELNSGTPHLNTILTLSIMSRAIA